METSIYFIPRYDGRSVNQLLNDKNRELAEVAKENLNPHLSGAISRKYSWLMEVARNNGEESSQSLGLKIQYLESMRNLEITEAHSDVVAIGEINRRYASMIAEIKKEQPKKKVSPKKAIGFIGSSMGGLITLIVCIIFFISGYKGPNPRDYYGTYYCVYNNATYAYSISKDSCTLNVTYPLGNTDTDKYSYDYVSAKYLSKHYENYEDAKQDAILVYTDAYKKSAVVLLVESKAKNNYVFYSRNMNVMLTTEAPKGTVDPRDYYGTYYGTDGSSYYTLLIESDTLSYSVGTKTSVQDKIQGSYSYVSASNLAASFTGLKYKDLNALVVKVNEKYHIFYITSSTPGSYSFESNNGISLTTTKWAEDSK